MTCTEVTKMLCRPPTDFARAEVWASYRHIRGCPSCSGFIDRAADSVPICPEDLKMVLEILLDPELGGQWPPFSCGTGAAATAAPVG